MTFFTTCGQYIIMSNEMTPVLKKEIRELIAYYTKKDDEGKYDRIENRVMEEFRRRHHDFALWSILF